MNSDSDAAAPKAPLRRRLLGSFLSALAGWLTLNVFVFGYAVTQLATVSRSDWWLGPVYVAAFSVVFVFGTWLVALLPLYVLVPLRSCLWRWYICTACGAISGAAIMYLYSRYDAPQAEWGPFAALAAITGGAACLFGSLTSRRFQYDQVA